MQVSRFVGVVAVVCLFMTAAGCAELSGITDTTEDNSVDVQPDAPQARCGDNMTNGVEQCDTGAVNTASCDSDCTDPVCGDGLLNPMAGEQCDSDDETVCNLACRPTVLSNGGFESEGYTGWTLQEESTVGSHGAWGIAARGTRIELTGEVYDHNHQVLLDNPCLGAMSDLVVETANESENAAVRVQTQPDIGRMYQDVNLPSDATTLRWTMAYRNRIDFSETTQFIAINIRDTADAILETPFKTERLVHMPDLEEMTQFDVDISQFAGQTVRIDVEVRHQSDCMDVVFDSFHIL